jgi:WD40 repeat protein/mono/diheme cytochrome c family protein
MIHAWRCIALSTVCLSAFFVAIADLEAADETPAAGAVSYYRDIRPIFQANCQGCHQPAKQGGEYVMTAFETLIKGGKSGDAAIVPGKPDGSFLIELITPVNGKADMPKGNKPLADNELQLITRWIAEGAKDDTPVSDRPQYDMEHPPIYRAAPVITSLDFSPDGKLLAVSGYHEVLLHNADGSGLVGRLVGMSERIESAVFSQDGKRLAVAGGSPGRMGEVQVWDIAKKKLQVAVTIGYDTCYGASWSPDGKLVAFGCPDNTTRAINSETGEQVLFSGAHNDWVLDTVFSTQSDHLITVSRDMSMKLVEVKTQRFVDNITSITPGALKGGLNAIDRHPTKDELLIGGSDGTPQIYQMVRTSARKIGDNANLIRAFPSMPGRVFDVKYSPDGNRIAAGSSSDGTGQVRVYNAADAKEITTINVPEGGIFAVSFSRDGKVIASGGFDGEIRLNDAATGALIKKFTPAEIQDQTAAVIGKQ